MKNFLFTALVLFLFVDGYNQVDKSIRQVKAVSETEKFFVGEDLTYVVKYAFFNLGEVRFKVLEKTKMRNKTVYKTIAYINSYPDLPFVSLKSKFRRESWAVLNCGLTLQRIHSIGCRMVFQFYILQE
ncbi:MAG: hypothetical protein MUE64_03775 [Ignavibacteriaceae bacterium]|nr:hypothetical protein [Ignavibacteriaceae bacterium]